MNATHHTNRLQIMLLLALALVLPLIVPTYYTQFASKAMLISILALSLNLVVGHGGLVSLCHGAFSDSAVICSVSCRPMIAARHFWSQFP